MTTHPDIVVDFVDIVHPNKANNALSVGYQLHIKGSVYHSVCREDLEALICKHGLAVKTESNTIIVYKPKKA
jgi:hypothetical protein